MALLINSTKHLKKKQYQISHKMKEETFSNSFYEDIPQHQNKDTTRKLQTSILMNTDAKTLNKISQTE